MKDNFVCQYRVEMECDEINCFGCCAYGRCFTCHYGIFQNKNDEDYKNFCLSCKHNSENK